MNIYYLYLASWIKLRACTSMCYIEKQKNNGTKKSKERKKERKNTLIASANKVYFVHGVYSLFVIFNIASITTTPGNTKIKILSISFTVMLVINNSNIEHCDSEIWLLLLLLPFSVYMFLWLPFYFSLFFIFSKSVWLVLFIPLALNWYTAKWFLFHFILLIRSHSKRPKCVIHYTNRSKEAKKAHTHTCM